MPRLRLNMTMSLDGYVAGPGQSLEHPLGEGGRALHQWAIATRSFRATHGMEGGETGLDDDVAGAWNAHIGATIMGRNMFGPVRGEWPDDAWKGWWGDDPPYHGPVFVLTHHAREALEMAGGTTFHFVTEGVEAALAQARAAAGAKDVHLSGGASLLRQCLAAGLVEQLDVSLAPVFLGRGERPFDGPAAAALDLEQVRVIPAPGVTHLRYRVKR